MWFNGPSRSHVNSFCFSGRSVCAAQCLMIQTIDILRTRSVHAAGPDEDGGLTQLGLHLDGFGCVRVFFFFFSPVGYFWTHFSWSVKQSRTQLSMSATYSGFVLVFVVTTHHKCLSKGLNIILKRKFT